MIVTDAITDFNKIVDIVSCFVEYDGKHLLLQRQSDVRYANQWGPPAGKVNQTESLEQAMLREVKEESGIELSKNDTSYFGSVDVRHGSFDFTYHIFSAKLTDQPEVTLSAREHQSYSWKTPKEALSMDMVEDQDWCVRWFYEPKTQTLETNRHL